MESINVELAVYILYFITSLNVHAVEVCQTETFEASCPDDQVIVMTSAKYGRMRLGKCVQTDFGFIGCSEDVLPLADFRCSGRHACQIRIPDADFDKAKPCIGDLTRYLEADYECINVVTANKQQCQASYTIQVPGPNGYLSSAITSETGCGTSYHPWVIEVDPTQRVNITLYDFSAQAGNHRTPVGVCRELAVIKEDNSRNVAVCAQDDKVTHVYTSLSNRVEIQITNFRQPTDVYFLLHYEAIGCDPPTRPANTWMKVDDKHVTIGCTTSEQTWRLKCVDGKWHGDKGSCSGAVADASMQDGVGGFMAALPNGYAIIIIIAIAMFISVVILIVGLVLYRRRKRNSGRNAMPLREPYYYGNGSLKSAATIYGKGDPRGGFIHIPKPPPPPGMRKNSAGVMSENEYTYRLRMQQGGGMMGHVPPPYCPSDFDNSGAGARPPIEHIYESPVFARRNRDVDGPQYFELDPEGESPSSKDSDIASPHHSNAINTNPAPMSSDPNQNYRVFHSGSM